MDNSRTDGHKGGDIWKLTPLLHDFITTRRESFGGYVYNPYLLQPLAVDCKEMKIVESFDGKRNVKEIFDLTHQSSSAVRQSERDNYLSVFHRLGNLFAINWINEKEGSRNNLNRHPPKREKTGDTVKSNHLSAPLSVLWDITYACNLKCAHCLSSSGKPSENELQLGEIRSIIDQLAALKVFTITFCGGEPLVRKDFHRILEYATNKNMGLKLSTNGTLVTNEILKSFDDFNIFAIQVSLDGTEKTHDQFRNQPGSYQKAIKTLKRLTDAGYYTVVAPVITKFNLEDMDHVLETAVNMSAASFKPSLFMPLGRGRINMQNLMPSTDEIKQYMVRLLQKHKEYQGVISIELDGMYPGLHVDDGMSIKSACNDNVNVGCSAGTTQVVITASGVVVPCSFLYDFVAGDLRKEKLSDIWHNAPIFEKFRNLKKRDLKGKCGTCEHIPERCQGGCRAAAYLYSGDLCAQDPICWN